MAYTTHEAAAKAGKRYSDEYGLASTEEIIVEGVKNWRGDLVFEASLYGRNFDGKSTFRGYL